MLVYANHPFGQKDLGRIAACLSTDMVVVVVVVAVVVVSRVQRPINTL